MTDESSFRGGPGLTRTRKTGTMVKAVRLSKGATKQFVKAPKPIWLKLLAWVGDVERDGLEEVRKIPGFHDELLKGKRAGQRSIRLSKKWRAIYEVKRDIQGLEHIEFALVEEVTPHKY